MFRCLEDDLANNEEALKQQSGAHMNTETGFETGFVRKQLWKIHTISD